MNSVINYYRNTLFSFGINFAEINLETLPCFSERSKKIPNGKHAFERGGKNSSEFLSSCNEDNLIKIKAKLIKNLKAQAFGCVISLKYGRLGLLSWAQFLVVQTGYASGSEWKCAAGLQFSDHSFWPFCSFLVFLLLCFWKKTKTTKQPILAGIPLLSYEFCLGVQLGTKHLRSFITLSFLFMDFMVRSLILKWKKKACSHTHPHSLCALFLALFLQNGEGIENFSTFFVSFQTWWKYSF